MSMMRKEMITMTMMTDLWYMIYDICDMWYMIYDGDINDKWYVIYDIYVI